MVSDFEDFLGESMSMFFLTLFLFVLVYSGLFVFIYFPKREKRHGVGWVGR